MLLYLAIQNARQHAVTGEVGAAIVYIVQWIEFAIETTGALIICIGVLITLYKFCVSTLWLEYENYNSIRLGFARYLGLALEFQLAADILSTSIAPSWEQIGKLAAIAVIRTALNYFLNREMQQERERTSQAG